MRLGGLLFGLVSLLALGTGVVGLVKIATALSSQGNLPTKTYNIVLLQDSTKLALEGTHITNNGFCSLVWKGKTLDTVVCTSHLITEIPPAPAASPSPAPQVSSLR